METAKFNKNGGPIEVEIKAGYAQPGTYSLFLWEANINKVIFEKPGNFINTDDDKYQLPLPIKDNDGRIIDVGITFVLTPPIEDYYAEVIVTQDGEIIGKDSVQGSSSEQTKSIKLLIQLEKA